MSSNATPDNVPSSSGTNGDEAHPSILRNTVNPNAGRGRGRRRGGRGRGRGSAPGTSRPIKPKFKGETEGMNGRVFSTPEESNDPLEYVKTAEMAERYLHKEFDIVEMSTIFDDPPTNPVIKPPEAPAADAKQVQKDLYPLRLKAYLSSEYKLQSSMRSFWSVLWGQCSEALIIKLEDLDEMRTFKKDANIIALLQAIQTICLNYNKHVSPYVSLHKHVAAFYAYRQKDGDTVHEYLELFKYLVQNIKRYGGTIGRHPMYIKRIMISDGTLTDTADDKEFNDKYQKLSTPDKDKLGSRAEERALGTAFLMGGNRKTYGPLLVNMQNQYLLGVDQMPSTLGEAYTIMANYNPPATAVDQSAAVSNEVAQRSVYSLGMSFLQNSSIQTEGVNKTNSSKAYEMCDEDPHREGKGKSDPQDLVPGVDGKLYRGVKCFRCNYFGHYPDRCGISLFQEGLSVQTQPEEQQDTSNSVDDLSLPMDGMCFHQSNVYSTLEPTWVLLDSQSNCDIFNNASLLTNIRTVPGRGLQIKSNGDGCMSTNRMGTVPGYGDVWYHERSLANILSMANVRKKFPVYLETGPDDPMPTISVLCANGKVMSFKENNLGLFVFDAATEANTNNQQLLPYSYSFVNTIVENESMFTSREVKSAKAALDLYKRVGRPSQREFIRFLDNNYIRNTEVTSHDAKRAFIIYGKDTSFIQGKTKRQKPNAIPNNPLSPVPNHVLEHHKHITLCIDIFYINGCRFFHTISRDIKFRTIEFINSGSYDTLLDCLYAVLNVYQSRGFEIDHIHGDGQFECLRESVRPTNLHISAAGEHVPEVERSIQTIEDDSRATYHSLPFKQYPKIMLVALANFSVRNRNMFPSEDNVCPNMGPTSIMTGLPMPDDKFFALEFGTYVNTHMITPLRSTISIHLGPHRR